MTAVAQKAPAALSVGGAFTMHRLSEGQVMALAAAADPRTHDPVDIAIADVMGRDYANLPLPDADPRDIDPATPHRRYSLTRVRQMRLGGGVVRDVVIMRGEMNAVIAAAKTSREERALLRRNASSAQAQGWRPLAVAMAPVSAGDKVGDFELEGFVSIGEGDTRNRTGNGPSDLQRVDVWSGALRAQHWINVACILTLSCTGYYILDPFFGPAASAGAETGYLMGTVRFIHFTAAFVWIVLGLTRVVLAFTSKDPHLRYPAFWPLKKKEDVRNLGKVVQYYALIKKEAPLYEGHNPLQQLTYTGVYVLCFIQMLIGLSLFSLFHTQIAFWAAWALPAGWIGIPILRLWHVIIMFVLWAFVIFHIYLAFRADSLERQGGISAMISGGVWLRKGAKPVDGPEVG